MFLMAPTNPGTCCYSLRLLIRQILILYQLDRLKLHIGKTTFKAGRKLVELRQKPFISIRDWCSLGLCALAIESGRH